MQSYDYKNTIPGLKNDGIFLLKLDKKFVPLSGGVNKRHSSFKYVEDYDKKAQLVECYKITISIGQQTDSVTLEFDMTIDSIDTIMSETENFIRKKNKCATGWLSSNKISEDMRMYYQSNMLHLNVLVATEKNDYNKYLTIKSKAPKQTIEIIAILAAAFDDVKCDDTYENNVIDKVNSATEFELFNKFFDKFFPDNMNVSLTKEPELNSVLRYIKVAGATLTQVEDTYKSKTYIKDYSKSKAQYIVDYSEYLKGNMNRSIDNKSIEMKKISKDKLPPGKRRDNKRF